MNLSPTNFASLENHGWTVVEQALPTNLTEKLLTECQNSWQNGEFYDAKVGRGARKEHLSEIRGDSILWLSQESASPAVKEFLTFTDKVRLALNERYFLGLKSGEFHFARYPVGHGYHKHLDQHRGQNQRKISMVLYLNPKWEDKDGGELCLFLPENPTQVTEKILPQMGKLILFRSDLIPHEVLPCFQIRWSLTGWLRTDFI